MLHKNAKYFSLTELTDVYQGEMLTAEDTLYDKARTPFYGDIDRRPVAIVRPKNAEEIAQVVNFARDCGVELAVRSGGHSIAGYSVSDGGIVIDLKNLKGIDIDAENRTVWAETGLTAGELTHTLSPHKLAVGFGDTGGVGIGGITLGGGMGFLSRKYGLSIDALLGAEIVTAEGRILTIDSENHPDLFWAIRGGGGNFGIVTRLKFRLFPVDTVLGGMIILPLTADTITSFTAIAEAAPRDLSAITNVMLAPPMPFMPEEAHGKLVMLILLVYSGDIEAGEKIISQLRALGNPIVDTVKALTYPEMFPDEELEDYHPKATGHTLFIDHIDHTVAEQMLERLQTPTPKVKVAQIRVLGGAIADIADDATAYAHRKAKIMINLGSFFDDADERKLSEQWIVDTEEALDQGISGNYVNFLANADDTQVQKAYGDAWERLREIKQRYDPLNLFHLNHNIPPADAS